MDEQQLVDELRIEARRRRNTHTDISALSESVVLLRTQFNLLEREMRVAWMNDE